MPVLSGTRDISDGKPNKNLATLHESYAASSIALTQCAELSILGLADFEAFRRNCPTAQEKGPEFLPGLHYFG
jgi:hypothetical protein